MWNFFGTETKFGHYSNTSMLRREFLVVHVLQHDCNLLSFVLFKVFPLLNGGFDADQSGNDRCIAHCWVPILGKRNGRIVPVFQASMFGILSVSSNPIHSCLLVQKER